MSIQRYDPTAGGTDGFAEKMNEAADGDWIAHTNHIAALEAVKATVSTPVSRMGGLDEACAAVRRYVQGKEWGGGPYTVSDGSWNERVAGCLADIRAQLASEGGE